MTGTESTSYEATFLALQEIITRLENNELPLEEALKLYEEGKKLSDQCARLLEKAQLRVNILGQPTLDMEIDQES
jgi:exodeoxyribonuclease VII small subunit